MNEYITYNYIRNKVRKFSKKELLSNLYSILKSLDLKDDDKPSPIWHIFLLIKWTYIDGAEPYYPKHLSNKEISELLKNIEKFEDKILNPYVERRDWDSFFQIIGYQQFYLQKNVHWVDFAQQLKIFTTLKHKYDIDNSFREKTGLSVYEFLATSFILWMYSNINSVLKQFTYNGYIGEDVFETFSYCMSVEILKNYIQLLILNEENTNEIINAYKRGLNRNEYQPFEISFFTMYPFQNLSGGINIIHKSIFAHTCCYYIYDYLKESDEKFSEEFGRRFEKYVGLGLEETKTNFITENELKKLYGKDENVVDYLVDDSILIECKGVEPKPLPSVKPTIEITYNNLKDSIIKAYTKQMLNVLKNKNQEKEYYGIIVTYKDFYYSSLEDLWLAMKGDVEKFCSENNFNINLLPPEKVLVINISSWDKIVQILKTTDTTLSEILKKIYDTNKIEKMKNFNSHFKDYEIGNCELNYLKEEYKKFDVLFTSKQDLTL